MTPIIYNKMYDASINRKKQFAVLIDPDKVSTDALLKTIDLANEVSVDYIFVGGSLVVNDTLVATVDVIKSLTQIPIVLFPGSNKQISRDADALLLLSLISGRNAEWLISQHVEAAMQLRESQLEIIPTGYMLIDGGRETSVTYVSQTKPIPSDKTDIAVSTALAGNLLGMKVIFMDAGSGALKTIPTKMIQAVKSNISLPLIIGGGINTAEKAIKMCNAGADIIVVGNAIEKDVNLMKDISKALHQRVSLN
jgi:phosphoglycerol geranylgeranyltransferase